MQKKLQVFVSSTYKDLLQERQAAVEAILNAGHIPAGMELFAAGDASQLTTIRQWIDQSDVFMLILGGRYGSIEPKSKKSYIQLEYEYAARQKKPYFAVVLSDDAIKEKAKAMATEALEVDNPDLLKKFRRTVTSKICRMARDPKDLKLAVFESLGKISNDEELAGWVRGSDVTDPAPLIEEMKQLRTENTQLKKNVADLEKTIKAGLYEGRTFTELVAILVAISVRVPKKVARMKDDIEMNVAQAAVLFADSLVIGSINKLDMSDTDNVLFFCSLSKAGALWTGDYDEGGQPWPPEVRPDRIGEAIHWGIQTSPNER